jgi:anti-anti-sigma regulatory factor
LRLELTGGMQWSNCGRELDIASVSGVAEVVDGLAPDADGVRHVVLDLRGLTFMDAGDSTR